MRLAIDGRFLGQPLSGVQRYAREVCSALDQALEDGQEHVRDLEVTLLVPRRVAAPPYRHLRVRAVGRLSGHVWEQLELPWATRRYDVLFCPGNVAPLMSLHGRTPVVVTVHDLAFRYHPESVSLTFRRVYEVLVPRIMRRADRILTVSEAERDRMLQHFPEAGRRLVAVANGSRPPAPSAEADADADAEQRPPSAPFVLYVGALNHRKNVDGVLTAARRLLDQRPGLRAVFIGASAPAYSTVAVGDADERMVFAGSVDDEALDAHYRAAELMLFPSFHEASGLPPVEAMSRGCPVVVSDIPALRERCADAAVYCDPHDVNTIVAAAESVLDDPPLRDDLVRRGRERAAAFSWDRTLRETLTVIREAVDEPRR